MTGTPWMPVQHTPAMSRRSTPTRLRISVERVYSRAINGNSFRAAREWINPARPGGLLLSDFDLNAGLREVWALCAGVAGVCRAVGADTGVASVPPRPSRHPGG